MWVVVAIPLLDAFGSDMHVYGPFNTMTEGAEFSQTIEGSFSLSVSLVTPAPPKPSTHPNQSTISDYIV